MKPSPMPAQPDKAAPDNRSASAAVVRREGMKWTMKSVMRPWVMGQSCGCVKQPQVSALRLKAFSSGSPVPGLDRGWIPVRVKKTRQNKKLEPGSDSIRTRLQPCTLRHTVERNAGSDYPIAPGCE